MTNKWDEYATKRRGKVSPGVQEFHNSLSHQYQIAAQIMQARKLRELTQVELASLSGVQQADISRIENGQMFPTTETLSRLLSALNAKVSIELVS